MESAESSFESTSLTAPLLVMLPQPPPPRRKSEELPLIAETHQHHSPVQSSAGSWNDADEETESNSSTHSDFCLSKNCDNRAALNMRRAKSLSAAGSPPDGRPVHGHLKDSGVCLDNLNANSNHPQPPRNLQDDLEKWKENCGLNRSRNRRGRQRTPISVGSEGSGTELELGSGAGPGSAQWIQKDDECLVVRTWKKDIFVLLRV